MTNQEMFKQEFINLLVKYSVAVSVEEDTKGWNTQIKGISFYSKLNDIDFTLGDYIDWMDFCE